MSYANGISHLYKVGNVWYYSRGGGRSQVRTSLRTTDVKLALRLRAKLDSDFLLKANGLPAQNTTTVDELVAEYNKLVVAVKPISDTWKQRCRQFHDAFSSEFGATNICEVTTRDINVYIVERLNTHAPKSVREEVSEMARVFTYAVNNEYLSRNPFHGVSLPSKAPVRERVAIPHDVILSILSEADSKDVPFWTLMYYTGMDVSEAGNLTPENFSLDKEVQGLAREKTGTGRALLLHPRIKALGNAVYRCMPTQGRQASSRKRFQRLAEKHGYKNDKSQMVDLKCLRHSFVTRLTEELGLDEHDIKALTGHTSTKTTREHYTKLSDNFVAKTLAALS